MKLATTTCGFNDYTGSQIKSLQLIREAGFILRREGAGEAVRFVKDCGFDAFEVLQALRPGAPAV